MIIIMSTIGSATFEKRLQQAQRLKNQFPDSVPVVVLKDPRSSLPDAVHNQLFVVPKQLPASEFTALIRKKIHLPKTQTMVLFINSRILITAEVSIFELYTRHCAEDGYLYILCTNHESFGHTPHQIKETSDIFLVSSMYDISYDIQFLCPE